MTRPRVLVAFGTRPEVIKMAPVVHALRELPVEVVVVHAGQHLELADLALDGLDLPVDHFLTVMQPGQEPGEVLGRVLGAMGDVLRRSRPALVLVHGDTTTAAASALAAHQLRIPVAHVEAGLRSGSLWAPWPEEANRRIVDSVSSLHFAPTATAAAHLAAEGHAATTLVTGNTVIDALMAARDRVLATGPWPQRDGPPSVLVTQHRRESIGPPLVSILEGVRRIAESGALVTVPVHPNPEVRAIVVEVLGGLRGVRLLAPQGYTDFVRLMMQADVIVTDSGGIQEEAPALGIPVVVTRRVTERPEAIACGAAVLVGTDGDLLARTTLELLRLGPVHRRMAGAGSPYGDGRAAQRVVEACADLLGVAAGQDRTAPFEPGIPARG